MNLTELRHDAARTLMVSYNANQDAIDAACIERLWQYLRMDETNTQFDARAQNLYNAYIRMSTPPALQPIANIRVVTADEKTRATFLLIMTIKAICAKMPYPNITKKYNDRLQKLLANIGQLRKSVCAICLFEILCVWTVPNIGNSDLRLGGFAIMLLAVFHLTYLLHCIDKKTNTVNTEYNMMMHELDRAEKRAQQHCR